MTDLPVVIRQMTAGDVQEMLAALESGGFHKSAPLFDRYLCEQNAGDRIVLLAYVDGKFAGYLTVIWNSDYPHFRDAGIPEVNDFNVLPELRRRGVGSRLMDEAERLISERSAYSGIGFGMGADYGPAQRMYVLRGYVPDGNGLMDGPRPVTYGEQITVSHDLAIYMVKKLR